MNLKQLQAMIAAGLFSATMMSGAAYADDTAPAAPAATPAKKPMKGHHHKGMKAKAGDEKMKSDADANETMKKTEGKGEDMGMKKASSHSCAGQNACKGQGGCKTDKHACKGQNACKGQGGCNS